MADHTFTGSIGAPADEVWEIVRVFTDGSWMGVEMTTDGDGVGATRTIVMGPSSITEACERLDDDARVLGYTITEGAGLPFEEYHATMTVNADGDDKTDLLWEASYVPVGDPARATETLDAIYGGGFAALKKHAESA